jgi:hypothetical protein
MLALPLPSQAAPDGATVMREAVAQAQARNARSFSRLRSTTDQTTPPADSTPTAETATPDDPPVDASGDPLAGTAEPVQADQPLEINNQGSIDGIYRCQYDWGGQAKEVYVSVNGKSDGQSIFVIGNVPENSFAISGWGAGKVLKAAEGGYAFVGKTDNDLPFFLAVDVASDGSATADGSVGVAIKGETIIAQLSCKSIW